MKKIIPLTLAALTMVTTTIPPAMAQFVVNLGNINAIERNLQSRINSGRRAGWLTFSEYRQLENRLNQIERVEQRLRFSGGRLSANERLRLERQLVNLNAQITAQLNDNQTRFNRMHRRHIGHRGLYWR